MNTEKFATIAEKYGEERKNMEITNGAFSGPKTRPRRPAAAVAEQTGRLTWIFFVMFDESAASFCIEIYG